ncbi:uncharacterized protein LOC126371572 [Pectinophora gossypiella]|uniref:uncharacterized protein LOC126368337 n=1 Tax=Pectinophora gossypiella TaxID=13191 RepID=UPI00214E649C|nr:uncharacterized protein LOC126368337 [Pectinophora gossypiella]XP_049872852.1 uncharacterized protein LOC126371572 [Pectinophora gossypiella]
MSFGFRTPAKRIMDKPESPKAPEKPRGSPSSQANVRLSIDAWEAGEIINLTQVTPPSQPKPEEAPPPKSTQRKRAPTQGARAKISDSPLLPSTPVTRAAKARTWVTKGKTYLSESKNMKTELKNGLIAALDNLYRCYKEAEADKTVTWGTVETGREQGEEEKGKEQQTIGTGNIDEEVQDRIIGKIEEQTRLLLEHGKKLDELRETLEKKNEDAQILSYASVVAGPPKRVTSERTALHSVVITSADKEETGEEILDRVRKAVNAKDGGIEVERVRKAKDRKIILGCKSKEERKRVKDRLESAGQHLSVEEVKNKDPMLIFRGVLRIHSDEEVLRALRNQNRDIFHGLDAEENRVTVKYRRNARNPSTNNIIVTTSPTIWNRALNKGRVRIDLQTIYVEDQSPLVQCTRCLGYGHGRRFCKEPADLCSHCAGPHLRAECPQRTVGAVPECRNCMKADLEDAAHNAFSNQCPTRMKWDRLARASRKKLATQELMIEAGKRKATAALIQEPYVGGATKMSGFRGVRVFQSTRPGSGTVKAAIAIFDPDLNVIQYPELTTENIVVVGIQTSAWKLTLVSFYFEPDQPLGPYLDVLKKVENKTGPNRLIVGGDANAWSIWWGSRETNDRGDEMLGALDQLGLQILNTGETPTFDVIRGERRYTSCVDITACTADMLSMIDSWRVVEDLTGSDHNGIEFQVNLKRSKGISVNRTTRVYNTKKTDWVQFHAKLNEVMLEQNITPAKIAKINSTQEIEQAVKTITSAATEASSHAMPKKKNTDKLTVPWWSDELASLKKEVATRKRRIRCAASIRRPKVVEEYLKHKEKYELEVVKAQVGSWKDFCGKQTREGMWEGIYRVIGRTSKREEDVPMVRDGVVLDAANSARYLAETFYPRDDREKDNDEHRAIRKRAEMTNEGKQGESCDPPFTADELLRATKSFNPKKAPGSDGLTADIWDHLISSNTDTILRLMNKCLTHQYFPRSWKEATVIVLRKPGKECYDSPKSYRPIGLLPVLGKIYEKMIVARLKFHLLPKMSTRQYGFMPQKSTEDSLYTLINQVRTKLEEKKIITLVSLDIEGAFDSAWWPKIKVRLAEERCPANLRKVVESYLSERTVSVRYGGAEYKTRTEKGCVQGSIGGPILWNLLLDPLLKGLEERGHQCQAFADDVVLIFDAHTAQEIQRHANAALEYVRVWGVMNKLKFAPHKTSAMLVTRKLKHDTPHLTMGGIDIAMSKQIKLLGLTIDNKLTFNTHVANVCSKAVGIYKQLSRAARVSWGLHPEVIRSIYTAVIEPIVLYAASAWAPASNKLGVRSKLNSVQRSFAQKMCRAYRTVSLNSALVLAGILPLDLRIQEAASLYEARRGVCHPALAGGDIERVASALQMPHPAERRAIELRHLVDEEQYRDNSDFQVRIFTDGSKIEGKVGAALSIWTGAAETKTRKLALPSYCTVYQAELLALCEATREALKRRETSFAIYSDSMAALLTVVNPEALHPLAVDSRDAIYRSSIQNKSVSLFWIKAHAGLEGNERADSLAKEAALKSKRKPDYDMYPVSFVKRFIRMDTLDEWNRRYSTGHTASTTKLFFPSAVEAYRTIRKLSITKELTQALTGHGGFSEYLTRFKCKENPACACDPNTEETVPHLLVECPIYGKDRFDLEQKTGYKIEISNLNELVTDKKFNETFRTGMDVFGE